jgi:hypothetical protein
MLFRLYLFLTALFGLPWALHALDSLYIHVHFLYGSKPKREFRESETKWFGGRLGGHAGIETDSNFVIDFVPRGDLHIFSDQSQHHSKFTTHTTTTFFEIFGGVKDSVSYTTITIPISKQQKVILDSLSAAYRTTSPYDYAFFGMRCGAATYDLLANIGILTEYSESKTWRKIFYPRKLRRRLTKLAMQNNWAIEKHSGSSRRKWERE